MNFTTAFTFSLALALPAASAWALEPVPYGLEEPGVLAYGYEQTPGDDGVTKLAVDRRNAGTAYASNASNIGNFWAQATMTEGLSLPQLRLYAEAHGNPARTYIEAAASAWQHYAYTGSTAMNYTLRLTFDGKWAGTNGGSAAYLTAGLGTLDTDGQTIVDWDVVPGLRLEAGADASPRDFTLTGDINFTLTPGGSIDLISSLYASAIPGQRGWSIQDISHTYSMEFLAGDVNLLVPTVTAVPEPSAWLLAIAGVLVVGRLSRQSSAPEGR
jgi:hypothetical protein